MRRLLHWSYAKCVHFQMYRANVYLVHSALFLHRWEVTTTAFAIVHGGTPALAQDHLSIVYLQSCTYVLAGVAAYQPNCDDASIPMQQMTPCYLSARLEADKCVPAVQVKAASLLLA